MKKTELSFSYIVGLFLVVWTAQTAAAATSTTSKNTTIKSATTSKTNVASNAVSANASAATSTSKLDLQKDSESEVKYKGDVSIVVLGRSMEDQNLKSTVGWTFIKPSFEADYFDWMKFRFGFLGIFGEGAGQNYLTGDGGSANLFVIDVAGVDLKPFEPLTLSAGIITYRINPLMTTMTPGTSPALEQKLVLKDSSESVKFSVIGNEAIPSLGVNKTVVDKEKSPFFLSGSAKLDTKITGLKSELKLATTKFKFGNLPANTAAGALTAGNSLSSVSGTGDDMKFVIGFSGTESAAAFETEWTSYFKTTLKGVYIKNDLALENYNQGKVLGLDLEFKNGNTVYSPWVSVFEVQSDVTPASFSIFANRLNNRKGYKTGMSIELVKKKITFSGSYSNYDVLEKTPFLTDREIYNLGLEVNYDILK